MKFDPKLIIFLSVIWSSVFGQNPIYDHFTVRNGLSSSEVHDIIQDQYGYLWISTDYGLNRYDGYTFEHYTTDDGLTDNTVFNFFPQENGDIWLSGNSNRMVIISGFQPTFREYEFNDILQANAGNKVMSDMLLDTDGSAYFKFLNYTGLMKVSKEGELSMSPLVSNNQERVVGYIENSHGNIVYSVAKMGDLEFLKNYPHTEVQVPESENHILGKFGAIRFRDHYYFIAKNILISKKGDETSTLPLGDECLHIGLLDSNRFWVSTMEGGVHLFNSEGLEVGILLPGKTVTRIIKDHEGALWMATLFDGVYRMKNEDIKTIDGDIFSEGISDLETDSKGNLWIGTREGDVFLYEHNQLSRKYDATVHRAVKFAREPETGLIYFISGINLVNGNTMDTLEVRGALGIEIPAVDSIMLYGYSSLDYVRDGKRIVIAEGDRVVDHVHFEGRDFIASKSGLFEAHSDTLLLATIANKQITDRISDLEIFNDFLVIGCRTSGLYFYKDNRIYHFDKSSGLMSNFVRNLYSHEDSVLWVCTNDGLNKIDFQLESKYSIKQYSTDDGLISNEVTDVIVLNDTVWVGTRSGLNFLNINYTSGEDKNQPYHLMIKAVEANDVVLDGIRELNYKQNRLEFYFSGISFSPATKLLYRYRLNGMEENWNYTTNTSVVYPSLPPGDYEFVVQLKGQNDKWEMEQQQFSFSIYPPYWQTWWFRSFLVVLLGTLIYLFFKFRILIYNGDLVREILRYVLKRIRKDRPFIVVRESGRDAKIYTDDILFVKSDGNYLEIHTESSKYLIRQKIGEFLELVPDPIEFIRIRRSYIVRIDKVTQKGKRQIFIGDHEIQVGETFLKELDKIQLK